MICGAMRGAHEKHTVPAVNKALELVRVLADEQGNLIFTCPGGSEANPVGYVCCRRWDSSVKKIAEGLYFNRTLPPLRMRNPPVSQGDNHDFGFQENGYILTSNKSRIRC
jgi:hypothetical protein